MKKLLLIICVILFLGGCDKNSDIIYMNRKNESQELKLHYLDIKNGRCLFAELPNGEYMLVDSGATEDFPTVYEYLRKLNIKNIDYMIISANDKYHLGGASKILSNFIVHEMFVSKSIPDENLYRNMAGEAVRNNCRISIGEPGTEILSYDRINISIISPVHENYLDYEDFSLSIMLTYGDVNYFLMANCTEKTEKDMIMALGDNLKSDLLSTSCNEENNISTAFLQSVSPRYSVIQIFNKKIPNKSTLKTMEILGIYVLRTDVNGNIVITSSSKEIININTQR